MNCKINAMFDVYLKVLAKEDIFQCFHTIETRQVESRPIAWRKSQELMSSRFLERAFQSLTLFKVSVNSNVINIITSSVLASNRCGIIFLDFALLKESDWNWLGCWVIGYQWVVGCQWVVGRK